ncbi:sigma-54-dependent transcriptional regulator [Dongia soli]|uniref:Sigma-54 dependent transcriptional regulator n=1 Tax=Dongia soli TaxID=600628 RepID=A0ABU5EA91_9PROT|nr:sigma-54 dependent transcriptional regulator [Dongia soli]MDY0882515.1 sigma-54 dependent transcriptional regulator [Dongia soli]
MAKRMDGQLRSDVLLVEDTFSMARIFQEYLRRGSYSVRHCDTGRAAIKEIIRQPPDVVLLDLRLPDIDGLEVLRHIRNNQLATATVVITADGSISTAVEAMREGAYDFLVKPFNADRLLITLNNVLERRRLSNVVATLSGNFSQSEFYGFIGKSQVMQTAYRMIAAAASSKATVFITGQSGTGKEVAAQAIHSISPRANAPFVPLNCAAVPKDLLESAIFGHVKGAFTGAQGDREGAAASADGGTLFLDEICEMSIDLQPKLLRFLQTGSFQRVGSDRVERVDVRILCATNRDPMTEVAAGRFREDLFYRLHVLNIMLPPLRERGEDILQLAHHFLDQYAREENKTFNGFAAEVERCFGNYAWPGNIRQLQNLIRNIVVMNAGPIVTLDMLPPQLFTSNTVQPAGTVATTSFQPVVLSPLGDDVALPDIKPLAEIERDAIEHAIARCDGNIPRAAAALGVSPSTLYRKRQSWDRSSIAS